MLSRRSLIVSLVLHSFLVLSGYLFFSKDGAAVPIREKGRKNMTVVSRPVRIEAKPKVVEPEAAPEPPALVAGAEASIPDIPVEPSEPVAVLVPDKPEVAVAPAPVRKTQPSRPTVAAPFYPQAPQAPKTTVRKRPAKKPKAQEPSPSPSPKRTLGWGPVAKPTVGVGGGENGTGSSVTRRARPSHRPEFNLAERFPELASVSVRVKFVVAKDGSFEFTVLDTTGNSNADVAIMGICAGHKWMPAMEKGVPKEDTRILDIGSNG